METLTVAIARMTRQRNTPNGGPRYAVLTANGVRFNSAPDAADSYGWVADQLAGKRVTLTLDSRQRVIGIDPVASSAAS